MQLDSPLDSLITAADRALRALFAPARSSRPMPEPPTPANNRSASASPASAKAGLGAPASPTSANAASPGRTSAAADATSSSALGPANSTTIAPPASPTFPDSGTTGIDSSAPGSAVATLSAPSPSDAQTRATKDRRAALADSERRRSAALMRVNHAGEIAAQALYHGQALVARSEATRELLLKAAREETDHLAWCETRLKELDSRPSLLNPLWYAGSFAIGALAALMGDRTSLGFVVETERQVEGHLDEHLARLPPDDTRSRAVLETMRTDEIAHGLNAKAAGGAELPSPVRALMRTTARVMTSTAYWI